MKAQVIGRRVGLKGKKESGKAEREKWQERINKCVPRIKCESVGYRSRMKEGMKKGSKGRKKGRKEGRKQVGNGCKGGQNGRKGG